MSHYFTDNSELKKNRKDIPFRFLNIEYVVTSDDGVFSKGDLDRGTEALLKTVVKEDISGDVADLGCGIGVIGVVLSQYFDVKISGFDINPRAVELAQMNYQKYSIKGNCEVSDGLKGNFDVVISNPPIRVGKEKLYELFDNVYGSLNRQGSFYFVIRKSHGAKSAQAKCMELFGNCELLKKDKGFYIYRSRKLT